MALRIRGRDGFYHAYYRREISVGKGVIRRVMTTVNLGTADLATAKVLEAELMARAKAARLHQRFLARLAREDADAGRASAEDVPQYVTEHRRRRLPMARALETAAKYRPVSSTAAKLFRAFAKAVNVRYMDEVTPEIAFAYLEGKASGKTYNNTRSALNAVFTRTLMESGMGASPFALIPSRLNASRHQRPFTEDEFRLIYRSAPEPWRTASLIAWFTGLREKDVFTLEWGQVHGDVIRLTPAKTRRFGRGVEIPVHPQLAAALAELPRNGARVLGAWPYRPGSGGFYTSFTALLKSLGIEGGPGFVVNFNSLRDSFVTRCDEAGIPRHAIRGMVGHMHDEQTDLYSHDLATARQVQMLPRVEL